MRRRSGCCVSEPTRVDGAGLPERGFDRARRILTKPAARDYPQGPQQPASRGTDRHVSSASVRHRSRRRFIACTPEGQTPDLWYRVSDTAGTRTDRAVLYARPLIGELLFTLLDCQRPD